MSSTDTYEIQLGNDQLDFSNIDQLIYLNATKSISFTAMDKVESSRQKLETAIENKEIIYGVTTGFGDSSRRVISTEHSQTLQKNLITYLTCGLGKILPKPVCRAVVLFRLQSLSRGYSSVSPELLKRMQWMVQEDVIPQIPSQGSLGASGDLVPLAYLAQAIQGEGKVWWKGQAYEMPDVLKKFDLPPYTLKAKEGLALVNGTTVMAAYAHHNLKICKYIVETTIKATALCTIGLNGRKDAFNSLVNSVAKQFSGQSFVAQQIWQALDNEAYQSPVLDKVKSNADRKFTIQDKYSLRCAPQILGPIIDTMKMAQEWIETEASSVSDNPLIDDSDEFSMGGNFYGGYISHAMDYMKLSMAHLADMVDRQFMCLIDETTNRGLTPNLSDWDSLSEEERFVHHGLKGLNQAMSAITSETMAQSLPGGIFSRSSESHNQDKVSLGLSACIQCEQMFENLFSILALQLIGVCQAVDLRKHQLKDPQLVDLYNTVRKISAPVTQDRRLDSEIESLKLELKKLSGAYNE